MRFQRRDQFLGTFRSSLFIICFIKWWYDERTRYCPLVLCFGAMLPNYSIIKISVEKRNCLNGLSIVWIEYLINDFKPPRRICMINEDTYWDVFESRWRWCGDERVVGVLESALRPNIYLVIVSQFPLKTFLDQYLRGMDVTPYTARIET